MMMTRICSVIAILILMLASCGQPDKPKNSAAGNPVQENTAAKSMMQGAWLDSETEESVFRVEGDTVFFADGTSLPAYFRVVGDSIELGVNTYHITKQTEHNFWFENHAGDEVRLVKRDSTNLDQPDFVSQEPQVITATEVVNLDSVVMYGGQRYHWYVTVNPTRYKVVRTTYTPEGVAVENVYYDNIIHVSVFKGAQKIYGHDFNKQAYSSDVPEDFLAQSILGNIRFSHVDSEGFHFNATVCIPDGAQCYMVENLIDFNGQMSMKLIE
ncbi:MAG: DUF4738 domain-containing protein [Prevotella sp.]|nr:DUF4738 domain-containing protein [Prevotella sp.]